MTSPDETRHPIEELAEEYLERKRRGESPTIEDFASAHPDHAEEIREQFPALGALEVLKSGSGRPASALGAETIENFGDFRVIGAMEFFIHFERATKVLFRLR